ncbi:MAG TPA: hypothetical protein ENN41_11235 [Sediminispirochaeta sp.]|nr:hypothetical protein [Sediminispirochaeta sp.]
MRLSVDIEPELKHKIAVLAALRGTTISDLVVKALHRVLAEEGGEELVKKTSDLAGALHRYADADKRSREDAAWAESVADDLR